jgi:hypothetical protein
MFWFVLMTVTLVLTFFFVMGIVRDTQPIVVNGEVVRAQKQDLLPAILPTLLIGLLVFQFFATLFIGRWGRRDFLVWVILFIPLALLMLLFGRRGESG